jgi:hypothetical protein
MQMIKSLAFISLAVFAVAFAGCGGDTTVVEHPEPAAGQPAAATPPPGGETTIETEHPDGSETTTKIENDDD